MRYLGSGLKCSMPIARRAGMKSPRENPAKQHVVLRPAPFDTETEGEEKVHVYLTHARDLMDLASPAQQGHGLEALLEREDPASALGRAFALLSPQEQYKALRFHRLNDGILYMASHAALRMLLSLEKGRRLPHEWLFASSNYGRPYLVADAFCDFNISHSWPWAAIAFCRHGRCGVDVELQEHLGDWQALIPLVCHENEQQRMAQAGRPAHQFLRLWTAKEAVSKVLGLGLSLHFPSMETDMSTGSIRIDGRSAPVRFVHLANSVEEGVVSVAWAGTPEKSFCCCVSQFNVTTGCVAHVGEHHVQ